MAQTAIQKIVTSIANGEVDDDLDTIAESIRDRRKTAASILAASISAGDRVRFTSHARPGYLVGLEATVTGKTRGRLLVQLDAAVGRFGNSGGPLKCPPEIVEKVAAKAKRS